MFQEILVAIDGSDHSRKALQFACDLTHQYSAKLTVLHVAYNPAHSHTLVLGSAAVVYQGSQKEVDEMARVIVDSARETLEAAGCGDAKIEVAEGPPARRILDYCDEQKVDLIILGSRGLSDVGGFLQGSVSHEVNHLCRCTCITVR